MLRKILYLLYRSYRMDPTGGRSDRLLYLYPKVDENETPLPRSWNPKDKYTYIGLSNNNLKVHYKGNSSGLYSLMGGECLYTQEVGATIKMQHVCEPLIPYLLHVGCTTLKSVSSVKEEMGKAVYTTTIKQVLTSACLSTTTTTKVHGDRTILLWSQLEQTSWLGKELLWLPCR